MPGSRWAWPETVRRPTREDQAGTTADSSFDYNDLDVLTASSRGSSTSTFAADPANALTKFDATSMTYGLDQRLRTSETGGVTTNHAFDANGSRTRSVAPNGTSTPMAYDQAGRSTSIGQVAGPWSPGSVRLRAARPVEPPR